MTRAVAIWQGHGWEYVAMCGDMWQGVGSCGRGWRHVTRAR